MNALTNSILQFDLPESLACPQPTEERNLLRDQVRLLISHSTGQIDHTTFNHLDTYLEPGDVLVINTSATIPSALPLTLPGGSRGVAHLSNPLTGKEWLVEIREILEDKTIRWKDGEKGMVFPLPAGASITLKERYYTDNQLLDLWVASIHTTQALEDYRTVLASPIKYDKLHQRYPLSYYQTYFSFHPGSAEMPSAGRGFTSQLVEKLLKKGVVFVPILLHTGVSSLEENEAPYPEYMELSPLSATILNTAKSQGRRIIAVGTTAIRAVESAADNKGRLKPYRGNTALFIDEGYKMQVVNGLITGFHEPKASHLHMLQALAGFDHVERAYKAALNAHYYWHQFGDLHLILP